MRKLFRQLHLWLSVPFGVVVTLVCFSGAMLVFEDEVVRLSHRELFHAEPVGRPVVTLDEAARRVAATLPEGIRVTGVTVEADPGRTWRVNLSRSKHAWAAVNPYTGEVVGQYERTPFFSAMFRLHRWLLGSRPADGGVFWGKTVVGVSTLLFVVVLLTGVVLWWPRTVRALRRSLSFAPRKGWRRFWYDLHVAGGMYALIFLLLMALTGLTWSFPWYRDALCAVLGIEAPAGGGHAGGAREQTARAEKAGRHRPAGQKGKAQSHRSPDGADAAPWQTAYNALVARCAGYERITVGPKTASVAYGRLGNRRASDRYDLDPVTGRITGFTPYADTAPAGKVRGWIYSLHVGSWGGTVTRLLSFVAALVGASLPLTGYYLWFRRLRARRRGMAV